MSALFTVKEIQRVLRELTREELELYAVTLHIALHGLLLTIPGNNGKLVDILSLSIDCGIDQAYADAMSEISMQIRAKMRQYEVEGN